MILLAYRHGLRASELVDPRWDQVDFTRAVLQVRLVKSGTPSTHPLTGREMRALRKLQRQGATSSFVFVSERGAPFTTVGLARMLDRTAAAARIEVRAHPHMLRHGAFVCSTGTPSSSASSNEGLRAQGLPPAFPATSVVTGIAEPGASAASAAPLGPSLPFGGAG
jgi:integrase